MQFELVHFFLCNKLILGSLYKVRVNKNNACPKFISGFNVKQATNNVQVAIRISPCQTPLVTRENERLLVRLRGCVIQFPAEYAEDAEFR